MGNFTGKTWPPHRIEQLKRLWSSGHTAAHIATIMGGISRNAVIGAARRAGCDKRASPITRRVEHRKLRRDEYSPGELRAAATRQDDAFTNRLSAAMQSKADARDHHGKGKQGRTVNNPGGIRIAKVSRKQQRKGVLGAAASSVKHRNEIVFGSKTVVASDGIKRANNASIVANYRNRAMHAETLARELIQPVEPLPEQRAFDGTPVRFAELRANGCQFAVTPHAVAPGKHLFCGHARTSGSQYCPEHSERARGKATQNLDGLVA